MPSARVQAGTGHDRSSRTLSLTLSTEHLGLAAVVLAQAAWLGVVMLRGWYSSADLPNLAYANGRALDWDYLTSSLGGHFGVAQRLVYWLLNRSAPLEWWLTVLIRLVCQAGTTILLWRLMRTLAGPRPWLWVVLTCYAFSAYLVPGTAALNSGLGLGIAQLCLVGALLAHVRWVRDRRVADAVLVAALVLVMLSFAQQSLPTLAFFPVLSLVFLQQGPWSERVRDELARWPGWAALVVALAAFGGFYLLGDYNSPSSGGFDIGYLLWLALQGWLAVLGPALAGGPWQFYYFPDQWSAYADPPVVLIVLGQVALLGLVVVSVRRSGFVALVAWLIPTWTAVASLVLVGTGRSWLEDVLPDILRYSFFVPVALALGVVLAFAPPGGSRPTGRRTQRVGQRVAPRALMVGTALLLVAASILSTARFAAHFWKNPAEGYTDMALAEADRRGPAVPLYDTVLPETVVPYISEMYVSDLLALGGRSADFEGQASDRLVVDGSGEFVDARFVEVADMVGRRVKGCGVFVSGTGITRVRLDDVDRPHDWFLQLELYQPRNNRVTLDVLDEDGKELAVEGGSAVLDPQGSLAVLHRRLESGVPAALEITSTDPGTNFCLVHTYVGVPLP